MLRCGAWVAVVCAVGCATSGAASAQAPRASDRGYVGMSIGALVTGSQARAPLTFPVYGESARVEVEASWPAGPTLELDAGMRLWRDVGVALSVSHSRRDGDTTLFGTIPHPYFFNQPRTLDAAGPSLARSETSAHIGLMWRRRVTRRLTVAAIGGPSIMSVDQDAITGISWTETYPYSAVPATRATVARREAWTAGLHVAGDVGVALTRHVGLVVGARYSHGSVTMESAPGQQIAVDVGGVVVRGGVRWLY